MVIGGAAALVVVAVLHVSVFGGVVVSGFWSSVNERFDPLAATHAVARIALAGSCDALVGGAAVWAAVPEPDVAASCAGAHNGPDPRLP